MAYTLSLIVLLYLLCVASLLRALVAGEAMKDRHPVWFEGYHKHVYGPVDTILWLAVVAPLSEGVRLLQGSKAERPKVQASEIHACHINDQDLG